MKNGLLALTCAVALAGCPSNSTPGTDAGSTGSDAPACATCGADGLPILSIGAGATLGPPNIDAACTARTEPDPGTASDRTIRLISQGISTADVPNTPFEIWPANVIPAGAACTAPDCISATSGADALATVSLEDDYFAYHVPTSATAMTYESFGFNFLPTTGQTEITTIPISIFMTAITLIRDGMEADPAGGIITGNVEDCDGEGMRGVTVRMFLSDGTEVDFSGTGPTDPGLAYRANGSLPNRNMTTTDDSGGYAAGNIPITDGRLAVVAYGTRDAGGAREIIGCEEVVVAANAITILSFGPYRTDYDAGNLCLDHAPTP